MKSLWKSELPGVLVKFPLSLLESFLEPLDGGSEPRGGFRGLISMKDVGHQDFRITNPKKISCDVNFAIKPKGAAATGKDECATCNAGAELSGGACLETPTAPITVTAA